MTEETAKKIALLTERVERLERTAGTNENEFSEKVKECLLSEFQKLPDFQNSSVTN